MTYSQKHGLKACMFENQQYVTKIDLSGKKKFVIKLVDCAWQINFNSVKKVGETDFTRDYMMGRIEWPTGSAKGMKWTRKGIVSSSTGTGYELAVTETQYELDTLPARVWEFPTSSTRKLPTPQIRCDGMIMFPMFLHDGFGQPVYWGAQYGHARRVYVSDRKVVDGGTTNLVFDSINIQENYQLSDACAVRESIDEDGNPSGPWVVRAWYHRYNRFTLMYQMWISDYNFTTGALIGEKEINISSQPDADGDNPIVVTGYSFQTRCSQFDPTGTKLALPAYSQTGVDGMGGNPCVYILTVTGTGVSMSVAVSKEHIGLSGAGATAYTGFDNDGVMCCFAGIYTNIYKTNVTGYMHNASGTTVTSPSPFYLLYGDWVDDAFCWLANTTDTNVLSYIMVSVKGVETAGPIAIYSRLGASWCRHSKTMLITFLNDTGDQTQIGYIVHNGVWAPIAVSSDEPGPQVSMYLLPWAQMNTGTK